MLLAYCVVCRKDSLYEFVCRFCISRNGWTEGGGGGVTRRVTYTWWLLGLAVKAPCRVEQREVAGVTHRVRFCVSRKGETGEVGEVTRRVTGFAVKAPWLGPGGPILALAA